MTLHFSPATRKISRWFFLFCGLSFCFFLTEAKPFRYTHAVVVTPQGVPIHVEVADTQKKRNHGLSFRKELSPRKGMLFVFEKREKHAFWMKDMFIPLDIIWLDNHRIVHMEQAVQPPKAHQKPRTLTPDKKANFVLEIPAGQVKALQLKVGQKLQYRF